MALTAIIAISCAPTCYDPYVSHRCVYRHDDAYRTYADGIARLRDVAGSDGTVLVHTSPFMRRRYGNDLYTNDRLLQLWSEAGHGGLEFGIGLFEDEPDGSCYYYCYRSHTEGVIRTAAALLRAAGVTVTTYRMGCSSLNEWHIPVLREERLCIGLNNVLGYIPWTFCDWTEAPPHIYEVSGTNCRAEGQSGVFEVPLFADARLCGSPEYVLRTLEDPESHRRWRKFAAAALADSGHHVVALCMDATELCSTRGTASAFISALRTDGVVFAKPSSIYNAMNDKAAVAVSSEGARRAV